MPIQLPYGYDTKHSFDEIDLVENVRCLHHLSHTAELATHSMILLHDVGPATMLTEYSL